MLATAKLRYLRTSARKARFVIDPLRGKSVAQALVILGTFNRRAAQPVTKLVASALANAQQRDATLTEGRLLISKIFADEGPMWKRFRAAAMGRATRIRKRTCHITVELDTLAPRPSAAPARPQAMAAVRPAPAAPKTARRPSDPGTITKAKRGPQKMGASFGGPRPLKRAAAAK